jgi:hypothetical protein
MRRLRALVIAATCLLLAAHPARAAAAFGDWAAIFVAGDDHAHSGAHSEVFDNARRDLATAFVRAGFARDHTAQFSTHPRHYHGQGVLPATPPVIAATLGRLALATRGGCLIYVTSHGGPGGWIVLGDRLFPAAGLAAVVDGACGERPTVVVVAACFSGAFIPPLSSPNRMILTAARQDRASFGCGEADRYTFFDTCVIEQLPRVRDFPALGRAVQACVARREVELGAAPPSEPQLWIGAGVAPDLPLLTFSGAPATSLPRGDRSP